MKPPIFFFQSEPKAKWIRDSGRMHKKSVGARKRLRGNRPVRDAKANPPFVIPAHNEEEFIFSCLDSLLKQSFGDFECIIVNDGSTDKTQDIVEKFVQNNLKFKIYNLKLSDH